jgi:hypothetical protein
METSDDIDYMYKEIEYYEVMNSLLKNYPIMSTLFPKISKKDFKLFDKFKKNEINK